MSREAKQTFMNEQFRLQEAVNITMSTVSSIIDNMKIIDMQLDARESLEHPYLYCHKHEEQLDKQNLYYGTTIDLTVLQLRSFDCTSTCCAVLRFVVVYDGAVPVSFTDSPPAFASLKT
ncbi:hypothetical protein F443_16988 [Phytophthora nicotianae P1569]|uniref:Uncharacterized protein n=1 Tax=Phytophthora nicotianae P1569 TaxID=1317065 RepID=V9ECY9_PHYNI|nr:hypothetical protein F443_16988 [Phytophthora nicotianae P1569]